MTSITAIEGIGPVNGEKLAQAGIKTVEALLKAGASASGRKVLRSLTAKFWPG